MKKLLKNLILWILVILMLGLSFSGCSVDRKIKSQKNIELMVSAATSLTDVMKEISDDYKIVAPDIELTFTFSSSGALQTQIEEGASADLFLSAGKKQMNTLNDKGLLLDGTMKNLLENKIVLIIPKGSSLELKSFEELSADKVKKIALGEPTGTPVGQYSQQVFNSLKISDKVKEKVNYASDVRQVVTWVESGEVDCGIVYETDAKTAENVQIVCEAPEGSHEEIVYPAAVVKRTSHPDEAKAFLNYLSTDRAEIIFQRYGFTIK
ncbi:MAG: molybdate ABC transporter substrate-binding protein [Clostridia bacterium]|nr:molybdate ABC transporter substrate-binding protein [Clostridia bacterium]